MHLQYNFVLDGRLAAMNKRFVCIFYIKISTFVHSTCMFKIWPFEQHAEYTQ